MTWILPGRLGLAAVRGRLCSAVARFALDGVQQRRRRVEIQRVAELVGLRRAGRFDAGGLLARVVPPVAALAERAEQIAQRAVAEKVERLVGDLEGDLVPASSPPPAPLAPLALGLEIRRHRDVALLGHPLDDLLNQLFELRARVGLIAVGRIAEQLLDRLLRQHAAVEQRVENRVVQRLHRPLVVVQGVRVAEAARQQQVRELRDQILQIEIVELVADVFRVAVLHGISPKP